MLTIDSIIDLNRPFKYTRYDEENVVRRLVAGIVGKTKQFVPDRDTWYFTNGGKTPVAVKRNMGILDKLGLDEHSTVGVFLKTVRQQAKKKDLSWLMQVN